MSTNDRDTHFQGWAALTWEDIGNKLEFWIDTAEPNFKEELLQILTQHAYDLVYHIRRETAYGLDLLNIKGWIEEYAPDMTELPD